MYFDEYFNIKLCCMEISSNLKIFDILWKIKKKFSKFRPGFFYFLVLGSADPIFLKTRIKIKVTLICFIFIFSADLNFPPQNEIKVD